MLDAILCDIQLFLISLFGTIKRREDMALFLWNIEFCAQSNDIRSFSYMQGAYTKVSLDGVLSQSVDVFS